MHDHVYYLDDRQYDNLPCHSDRPTTATRATGRYSNCLLTTKQLVLMANWILKCPDYKVFLTGGWPLKEFYCRTKLCIKFNLATSQIK